MPQRQEAREGGSSVNMRGWYVSRHLGKRRRKSSRTNRVLLFPKKTGSFCAPFHRAPFQAGLSVLGSDMVRECGRKSWEDKLGEDTLQAHLSRCSGPPFRTSVCWVSFCSALFPVYAFPGQSSFPILSATTPLTVEIAENSNLLSPRLHLLAYFLHLEMDYQLASVLVPHTSACGTQE